MSSCGLLAVRAYHRANGDEQRTVCLIPSSAHGTNAASAVMAGMKVVVVKTADDGEVDAADLRAKIELHRDELAVLMITYPSTHGVFEEHVADICAQVHEAAWARSTWTAPTSTPWWAWPSRVTSAATSRT